MGRYVNIENVVISKRDKMIVEQRELTAAKYFLEEHTQAKICTDTHRLIQPATTTVDGGNSNIIRRRLLL